MEFVFTNFTNLTNLICSFNNNNAVFHLSNLYFSLLTFEVSYQLLITNFGKSYFINILFRMLVAQYMHTALFFFQIIYNHCMDATQTDLHCRSGYYHTSVCLFASSCRSYQSFGTLSPCHSEETRFVSQNLYFGGIKGNIVPVLQSMVLIKPRSYKSQFLDGIRLSISARLIYNLIAPSTNAL